MPRNGSGSMSLTTTFTPNTLATSADVNTVLGDIADEITNSVAKDGQTPMTGALKLADGSAASPGATFGSDTNTGFYRISGDTIGIACNGAEVARVTTSGITLASGKTLSLPSNGGGGTVRPGDLVIFAGPIANIPSGRLLCDGAAVSRTTYSALFSAIGTMHGTGDGSTTFNLPDLRDKFIIGAKQDDSSVAKTNVTGALTQSGGSKDAVNVAHTHTGTTASNGAHTHAFNYEQIGSIAAGGAQTVADYPANQDGTTASNGAHTHTFTTDSSGDSGTNANLPPYYALAYTIQT
jgi:microcystin-dependent protein